MKKLLVHLAVLATLSSAATLTQAQSLYGGIGVPGIYTLGYAHSMGASWGLRGDYAGGLSGTGTGTDNGVSYEATIKASRAGLFADWFPFGGGFRLVGGVTANDMKVDVNAVGNGTATINGKPVNMANIDGAGTRGVFNVRAKFPTASPYLGIGYGHQAGSKGLGFYFDLGVMFQGSPRASLTANCGSLSASACASLRSEVAAEQVRLEDELKRFKYYPVANIGITIGF